MPAAALSRASVRLLLCLAAASSNLHHNILVEFVNMHSMAQVLARAITNGGRENEAAMEEAAQLVVLLSSYQRHEAPNDFLRLIHQPNAGVAKAGTSTSARPVEGDVEGSALLVGMVKSVRRIFGRVMYPAGIAADGAAAGSSWSHSFALALEWTAHMLTIEDYMPASLASQLTGAQANITSTVTSLPAHHSLTCSAL